MAAQDNKEHLIEQFSGISGADSERSRFYLESSDWNIETALSSFFEEPDSEIHETSPDVSGTRPDASRIKVIDMDDSSSDEEGEAFYAGGSEHSGQQVIGPGKKKDVVSMLFKSAKEHGAEVLDRKEKGKSKKNTFSGTGYRLGENENDHQAIPGTSEGTESQPRDVVLKMWKSGFTIDDGPIRAYDHPANKDFLGSVIRGQIPVELLRESRGGEVFINMEDHREEEYVAPKISVKAFTGTGHALGSVVPSIIGEIPTIGTADGASGTSVSSTPSKDCEAFAKDQLNVDSSEPTTNIQLRMPDGSRIVFQLNHTHTVGHIRQFIHTSRPSLPDALALMTTFPHVELKDDHLNLADAKLLNCALVVKTK